VADVGMGGCASAPFKKFQVPEEPIEDVWSNYIECKKTLRHAPYLVRCPLSKSSHPYFRHFGLQEISSDLSAFLFGLSSQKPRFTIG